MDSDWPVKGVSTLSRIYTRPYKCGVQFCDCVLQFDNFLILRASAVHSYIGSVATNCHGFRTKKGGHKTGHSGTKLVSIEPMTSEKADAELLAMALRRQESA